MQNELQINLSLPLEDVNILLAGLQELPAKHSMKVIGALQRQVEPQILAAQSAQLKPTVETEAPPTLAPDEPEQPPQAAKPIVKAIRKRTPKQ